MEDKRYEARFTRIVTFMLDCQKVFDSMPTGIKANHIKRIEQHLPGLRAAGEDERLKFIADKAIKLGEELVKYAKMFRAEKEPLEIIQAEGDKIVGLMAELEVEIQKAGVDSNV
ncbi:hypothetical protein [Priestia megaterium]|uniref:hypothetical protein n=1 Tax=Priestia megaterium TaxID=1404 RepID=UPI00300A72E2